MGRGSSDGGGEVNGRGRGSSVDDVEEREEREDEGEVWRGTLALYNVRERRYLRSILQQPVVQHRLASKVRAELDLRVFSVTASPHPSRARSSACLNRSARVSESSSRTSTSAVCIESEAEVH